MHAHATRCAWGSTASRSSPATSAKTSPRSPSRRRSGDPAVPLAGTPTRSPRSAGPCWSGTSPGKWKRRFACRPCARSFTETHDEIPAQATHTRRFDRYPAARGPEAPYSRVAEDKVTSARATVSGASRTSGSGPRWPAGDVVTVRRAWQAASLLVREEPKFRVATPHQAHSWMPKTNQSPDRMRNLIEAPMLVP